MGFFATPPLDSNKSLVNERITRQYFYKTHYITSQKIHSLPDKKTKPNQPNHNLPNKTNMKQY